MSRGLRCSEEGRIFPNQGPNPCPLHWQADSYPGHHQGSSHFSHFYCHTKHILLKCKAFKSCDACLNTKKVLLNFFFSYSECLAFKSFANNSGFIQLLSKVTRYFIPLERDLSLMAVNMNLYFR